MAVISLQELANCGNCCSTRAGGEKPDPQKLYENVREIALRAGIAGNTELESFAKDVAQNLHAVWLAQDERIGELEAEIEEGEICRDEIEQAIADKYDWDTASEIMEAARAAGKERRKQEAETQKKLAS